MKNSAKRVQYHWVHSSCLWSYFCPVADLRLVSGLENSLRIQVCRFESNVEAVSFFYLVGHSLRLSSDLYSFGRSQHVQGCRNRNHTWSIWLWLYRYLDFVTVLVGWRRLTRNDSYSSFTLEGSLFALVKEGLIKSFIAQFFYQIVYSLNIC